MPSCGSAFPQPVWHPDQQFVLVLVQSERRLSLRVPDAGVRWRSVARGLLPVQRLQEAYRSRGLRPGRRALLLPGLLRAAGGAALQPLQEGEEEPAQRFALGCSYSDD